MPPPTITIHSIFFTDPRTVQVVPESLAPPSPSQVQVSTQHSSVSTGTELLAYTNQLPPHIPLDSLFSHQSAPFSYPSKYGYSVVGKIAAVGTEISHLTLGTRVFAFREHTSAFHESPDNLHVIPDDISDLDALYFPTVETALSLAMDAAPLPGETICVVGQGLVGLTLVLVLKRLFPYSRVTTLDPKPARRTLSLLHAKADACLDPEHEDFVTTFAKQCGSAAGVDICIEISGAASGLDVALQCTRDHGKIVLGSWFGSKMVQLTNLGGRFHRSHIQIIASQVSHLPPSYQGRWTKERRNALAWTLIRDIRPASMLPMQVFNVHDAPRVYSELEAGEHLHVVFTYDG